MSDFEFEINAEDDVHYNNYIVAVGSVGAKIINTNPVRELLAGKWVDTKYAGIFTNKQDFDSSIAEEKLLLSDMEEGSNEKLSTFLSALEDPRMVFLVTSENVLNIALSEGISVLLKDLQSHVVAIVIRSNEAQVPKSIKNADANFNIVESKVNTNIVKFLQCVIELTSGAGVICTDFGDVGIVLDKATCTFGYGSMPENREDYSSIERASLQILHSIELPPNKNLADVTGALVSIRANEDLFMESFYRISKSIGDTFNDNTIVVLQLAYVENQEEIEVLITLSCQNDID